MRAPASPPHDLLVVNCWHDSNKGDAAITIGLLNVLREAAPEARLTITPYAAYRDPVELHYCFRHVLAEHPEAEVVQTILPALASSVGLIGAFRLALRGLMKLSFPRLVKDSPMEAAVRRSAAVISTGGLYFGFVNSSYLGVLYHLFAFSYPLLLARRFGVPYFLYAQSFGPFQNSIARWWMRKLVGASTATFARESLSAKTLAKLGAPTEKLGVIPDAAFGIDPANARIRPQPDHRQVEFGNYIAISLRDLKSAGHNPALETKYRLVFRDLIDWIIQERGLNVALVAHTTGPLRKEDDRVFSQDVYTSLSAHLQAKTWLIDGDLHPVELAQFYGRARLVVATRFHAAVLALCAGTPIIAIPYFGVKTQGSLQDLGLHDYILELQNLDFESITRMVDGVLDSGEELRAGIRQLAGRQYGAAIKAGGRLVHLSGVTPGPAKEFHYEPDSNWRERINEV